jgi:hypothetical protein
MKYTICEETGWICENRADDALGWLARIHLRWRRDACPKCNPSDHEQPPGQQQALGQKTTFPFLYQGGAEFFV